MTTSELTTRRAIYAYVTGLVRSTGVKPSHEALENGCDSQLKVYNRGGSAEAPILDIGYFKTHSGGVEFAAICRIYIYNLEVCVQAVLEGTSVSYDGYVTELAASIVLADPEFDSHLLNAIEKSAEIRHKRYGLN